MKTMNNEQHKWLLVMAIVCFIMAILTASSKGDTLRTYDLNPQANFPKHFVVSYAVTSLTYLFVTKRLGWDPIPSFFFSAMLTGMLGVVYEASESTGHSDNLGKAMLYNGAGSVAAGATFMVLEF